MAARLKAAGYTDSDITMFAAPDHPKEGGLVAVLKGSNPKLKPMLLLAHIDVVEAKREDWERDPFVMVEENGYFYARGTADDKAMAAMWVDTLIRFQQRAINPKRTIKVALTCGEETNGAFNGAQWLGEQARPDRRRIRAERRRRRRQRRQGQGGRPVGAGRRKDLRRISASKPANPGGHSSAPVPDNAIYDLSRALTKIARL
jgi:acetylornithine deacetylase/succinyl-diaminopimelate desuccinylase-like protein